jgi:hypothetical protein
MKKLFLLLSLLIAANVIVTPIHADYSEHVVPALKIAGGTLAAITSVCYAKAMLTEDNDMGIEGIPACVSAAILAAIAFDCTNNITIHPTIKIVDGVLWGLSAAIYALLIPLVNNGIRPSPDRDHHMGTKAYGPALISTALLSALAFKSAANDLM